MFLINIWLMIKNKKVLVNIIARSGSTGIKNKNIADLNGKPVLWYSITEALKSKYADDVCFSTDSQEYADLAKETTGLDIPFLREPKYAKKLERMTHQGQGRLLQVPCQNVAVALR